MSLFSEQEYLRYTRHLQLPQVGAPGQTQLKNSHVLIVGCGGLGAPVSLYLAAAGIGQITLVDNDKIELTNLQRQITFGEADLGKFKAEVTAEQLTARNSHINVSAVVATFNDDNAASLIEQADIVLDCTDNFATRYLINRHCLTQKTPWIYASIYQFSGQYALFTPDGPCYQCLYPEAPENAPDCNTGGVLGVLPGILGTLQANECIKYLLGIDGQITNSLMMLETLDMSWQNIRLAKDPYCGCCSKATEDAKGRATGQAKEKPANADISTSSSPSLTQQSSNESTGQINMQEIAPAEFEQAAKEPGITVLDVRTPEEHTAFNLADRCHDHAHLPLDSLVEAARNETLNLDKNRRYAVYCQAGGRSRQAVSILSQLGYNAINIQGGLQAILKES